jgi:hypothetical protein
LPLAAAYDAAVYRFAVVLLLLALASGCGWPNDPSSYGGIFQSRNLGGTWFRADVGLFLNAPLIVAVDSRNPSHLLAPISDCSVRATVGSPGLLKRRPRRGKENRDAGRSLRTARGAARLHRPSGADRLRAPIAQLPEYIGAGDGACLHDLRMSRCSDRPAGHARRLRLPDGRTGTWNCSRAFDRSRLPARSYQSLAGAGSLAAWRRPCSCAVAVRSHP